MTNNNPITPSPELFKQWEDDILNERDNVDHVLDCAWRNGFQAGADQELEACCEWLDNYLLAPKGAQLRAARRPKPPTLAEEALEQLKAVESFAKVYYGGDLIDNHIRRALERLQELEGEGDDNDT